MAHARKDTYVTPCEWWKHLRHMKRPQNKAERQAAKRRIRKELNDDRSEQA